MKRCLFLLLLLAFFPRCRPEPVLEPIVHEAEIQKWQKNRDTRLRREDGWLSLVGLHWLKEGANTVGSAESNDIVLPASAPAQLGTLTLDEGNVSFDPASESGVTINGQPVEEAVELKDDHDGSGPTLVHAGTLNFQIIQRADRHGVRVKDAQAETRVKFEGLEYFPIAPDWRVIARFEPYQPARQIPIEDVTGTVSNQDVPGALVFEVDGQTHRLDVIDDGSRELFVIFKDETSRDSTYPAGRYLYVSRPGVDGRVVVDFNKAYNPPCAFTPFATCPLPPPQNRLALRIEAGEKNYAKAKT